MMSNASEPDPEIWMPFVYGECSPDVAASLQRQLESDPALSARVDDWRQTMRRLDSWVVAPTSVVPRAEAVVSGGVSSRRSSLLTVAACAACVLLAFIAGRSMTADSVDDLATLRADLKKELAADLRTDLLRSVHLEVEPVVRAQLASALPGEAALRPLIETESARIMNAAVASWSQKDSVDRQRSQEMLASVLQNQISLRTDLENLAIEAEAQILRTRSELVRLSMSSVAVPRDSTRIEPDGGASQDR